MQKITFNIKQGILNVVYSLVDGVTVANIQQQMGVETLINFIKENNINSCETFNKAANDVIQFDVCPETLLYTESWSIVKQYIKQHLN